MGITTNCFVFLLGPLFFALGSLVGNAGNKLGAGLG